MVCVAALPAPVGGMNRSAWKEPTVQAEFDAWHARLVALGLSLDRKDFEDRLFSLGRTWLGARRSLLSAAVPYQRHLGTEQSWRMFVAPHTHPASLSVDVRENGVWRAVYVQLDPERDWRAATFEHHRFRSALFRYSWPNFQGAFGELAAWAAVEAAADFPAADAVRLRWYRQRSPRPEELRAGVVPEGRHTGAKVVEIPR